MATPAAPYPPVTAALANKEERRANAVQTALTRSLDALAGYDKMLPKAEPEVAPILRKLRETHHDHAERLAALITALGGTPDMDGSMMSSVNKAVVSLRAMFDDIDDDAVERAVDGETWVTGAFDAAVAEMSEGPWREDLAQMRTELDGVLVEARTGID